MGSIRRKVQVFNSEEALAKYMVDPTTFFARISSFQRKFPSAISVLDRFLLRATCAFFGPRFKDVSPEYFFAGVCCGGLITFPLQVKRANKAVLNAKECSGCNQVLKATCHHIVVPEES